MTAGREFEPHARKLLADYDEMMASIKRFSNSGHLHIGSVDHMGRVGLTTPISTFLKQYPDGGVTIDIERVKKEVEGYALPLLFG